MKKFLTFDGQDCVMSSVQQCSCPSIQCPQAIDTISFCNGLRADSTEQSLVQRGIFLILKYAGISPLNDLILKGCRGNKHD